MLEPYVHEQNRENLSHPTAPLKLWQKQTKRNKRDIHHKPEKQLNPAPDKSDLEHNDSYDTQ